MMQLCHTSYLVDARLKWRFDARMSHFVICLSPQLLLALLLLSLVKGTETQIEEPSGGIKCSSWEKRWSIVQCVTNKLAGNSYPLLPSSRIWQPYCYYCYHSQFNIIEKAFGVFLLSHIFEKNENKKQHTAEKAQEISLFLRKTKGTCRIYTLREFRGYVSNPKETFVHTYKDYLGV